MIYNVFKALTSTFIAVTRHSLATFMFSAFLLVCLMKELNYYKHNSRKLWRTTMRNKSSLNCFCLQFFFFPSRLDSKLLIPPACIRSLMKKQNNYNLLSYFAGIITIFLLIHLNTHTQPDREHKLFVI